jgi:hypothetical protein
MIPISTLISSARSVYPSLVISFDFPAISVTCIDCDFAGRNEDDRRALFFKKLDIELNDAEWTISISNIILNLRSPDESENEIEGTSDYGKSHHWIEYLAQPGINLSEGYSSPCPIIHFYGYKGGQARSTVLSMLAKSLAEDGYKVLAIDSDIEAPSLNRHFDAKFSRIEASLLGCVQYDLAPLPQNVYIPKPPSSGLIDLIACRPNDSSFDLDHASFAISTSLNPALLQDRFKSIVDLGTDYDLIFVDHRSGLSSSVLPLAAAFPGPVISFVRMDEQSDEALAYFAVLFSLNPQLPGLFVSFSLDPEETLDSLIGHQRSRIDSLLEILASAIQVGSVTEPSEEAAVLASPDELISYWISWFHDRGFLAKPPVSLDSMSADNRSSLLKIRQLLEIQASKKPKAIVRDQVPTDREGIVLTNSGNTDQGLLIQTDALRRLSVSNSYLTYILGRKGTGKTRLVRELVDQKKAFPLLVADDFIDDEMIKSGESTLKDIASLLNSNEAEKFWWILLHTAVVAEEGTRRERLIKWLRRLQGGGPQAISIAEIHDSVLEKAQRRGYVIDGVETAFNSSQMSDFVEGLFRFLSSVQSDAKLSQKLTIRLFIRTDLVSSAVENVEQQIEGRELRLSWNTQSILNFALSRISELSWFRKQFKRTTDKLRADVERLAQGAVPIEECNEFLLEMFPIKLRRNNLLTLTFLKDYFSEGVGDSASFYPRIYDTFLRAIAEPLNVLESRGKGQPQIEDGRVSQLLIIAAHDYASKEYLKQVAAELKNLIELSDDPKDNDKLIDSLIGSFAGLPTPFEFDKCLSQISSKISSNSEVSKDKVRNALQSMKRVGIFEDRPGYPGWWRVGRLFKTALGMKYVR